jgi:hypothetical protein
MNSFTIGSIVFACIFGGAVLGMWLRTALPKHHLGTDSRDLVNLVGVGLIGTMAVLVLGLMIASGQSYYDTQRSELTEMSAKIVLLDRILAHYGPEAKESRELLRNIVAHTLHRIWPKEPSAPLQLETRVAEGDFLYDKIQELSPTNDFQRSLQTQALSILADVAKIHWLMFEQGDSSISKPFLVVVVFWLTIIFIGFGLFTPSNATVTTNLFLWALSVSSAVFLILELYMPFNGLIRISSAPLQSALVHLGY